MNPSCRADYIMSLPGALWLSVSIADRDYLGAEANPGELADALRVRMAAEQGRVYPAARSISDSLAVGT
ncbi:hypothetical protein [Nocardia carnea]|uniref:hypothetical protein n=1 Tax=Nocardia carnea TaxID=37328 RepID=UPI002457BBA9|nr:hypothetical protein [Nocardia carnea]